MGRGVWADIVKVRGEIDGMGVEFSSSCVGILGDGRDIRFWVDQWVWEWDWVRSITGRVSKEFEDLLGVLQHVVISNNCRDRWRWSLDEDGQRLSRLIEENIFCSDNEGQETL
ncbi:hypothetical protein Tco_1170455 [Tanacetum coccineum]